MTKRPVTKKPDPKKAVVTELANCVVFALRYLDTKGGSGLSFNRETKKITRWQDDFIDALDKAGIVVDRDDYWKAKAEQKNKRRRR